MTDQINNAIAIQFADEIHLNGQQMNTRMRDRVRVTPMTTLDKTVETLDDVEGIEITGRHQKTVGQDIVHGRRRLRMREFRATLFLDAKDEYSVLVDAERNYAQSVARAMFRQFDRLVTEACLATVYTGRDMTTAVTAANDGVVTVDATSGLTYEKLLEIEENFTDFEIGTELQERKCLLITGEESTDLMSETELTSGDYTRQMAVDKGYVSNAAGLDIIRFGGAVNNPILAVDGSSVRSCIAMADNGVEVGIAKDIEVVPDRRPDLNGTKQVQAVLMMGAVRKEGARVQKVTTTKSA